MGYLHSRRIQVPGLQGGYRAKSTTDPFKRKDKLEATAVADTCSLPNLDGPRFLALSKNHKQLTCQGDCKEHS